MSLQKYAIIDTSITTGANVVNSIEYESQPTNPPPGLPETYIAVQSDTAGPGWTHDSGTFTAPPSPPPPTPLPPLTPAQKLAAAGLTVADLKSLLGLT